MSTNQVINAFDLLGQAPEAAAPLRLPRGEAPTLEVGWGGFRQSLWSSMRSAVAFAPKSFAGGDWFRDCWVERRLPRRAVLAAALWHLVFLTMPFPRVSVSPPRTHAFDNTELTWSGPINDLPLLETHSAKPKPSPRGEPAKPQPPQGADAFHPRQRIFTDPARPTHPRQMLVNAAAPPVAPKLLTQLPNIVQLAQNAGPARPRLEISQQTLANLHPKQRRVATVTEAPLPDIANLEPRPAEISVAASQSMPARPRLEINAGVAPRLGQKTQSGDVGPAPELGPQSPAGGPASTLIALSAAPGPVAPAKPPEGNLAARVAISPEGKKPGVPGANGSSSSANGGAAGDRSDAGGSASGALKDSLDISISGGNPPAKSGVSGLGGTPKLNLSSPQPKYSRSEEASLDDARTGPPNFAALPPGAKPEQLFGHKRVYTLYVNMPNLNSATGSWIMNFSELRMNPNAPRVTPTDVASPVPLRKVDPKYPPALMQEHVEGEVVLYAVIRHDGSVDSIQVVHGLDEQLDHNAMEALSQWKFRPAERDGTPVDLEAIIHIPFHAPASR